MGPLFPADYKPHKTPLKYKDILIQLTPEQEEVAMLYAKYIQTDYVQNKTFNKKGSSSEAEQVFTGYPGKEEKIGRAHV